MNSSEILLSYLTETQKPLIWRLKISSVVSRLLITEGILLAIRITSKDYNNIKFFITNSRVHSGDLFCNQKFVKKSSDVIGPIIDPFVINFYQNLTHRFLPSYHSTSFTSPSLNSSTEIIKFSS